MDPTKLNKFKNMLIVIATVITLAIVSWLLYNALVFRVTGTSPSVHKVSNISPFFKINFNKALSAKGLSISANSPTLIRSYKTEGKSIYIKLNYPTQLKTKYTITVQYVTAKDGKTITHRSFSFTPQAIPSYELSREQQQALIDDQDHKQSATNDPIVRHLPYGTLDFQLSALVIGNEASQSKLILHAKLLLSNADMSNKKAAITQYKKEVVDYIKSLNLDPKNYTIQYETVAAIQ